MRNSPSAIRISGTAGKNRSHAEPYQPNLRKSVLQQTLSCSTLETNSTAGFIAAFRKKKKKCRKIGVFCRIWQFFGNTRYVWQAWSVGTTLAFATTSWFYYPLRRTKSRTSVRQYITIPAKRTASSRHRLFVFTFQAYETVL